MIIKSFVAESASAALKMVREEMGGDAIVLKTRQVFDRTNRARVELTACIEKASVAQASTLLRDNAPAEVAAPVNRLPQEDAIREPEPFTEPIEEPLIEEPIVTAPAKPAVPTPVEPVAPIVPDDRRIDRLESKLDRLMQAVQMQAMQKQHDAAWQPLVAALRDADVSEDYINEFIDAHADLTRVENLFESSRAALVAGMAGIMVPDLKIKPGDRLLFIGPAGAGKSSVMGKLATQLVMRDRRTIRLACLDFQKVGAHEELAGYADLLGADVTELTDPSDRKADKKVVTLIDSPAFPTAADKRAAFIESIRRTNATHRFVVIPALMRSADVMELADALRDTAPTHIIATMLDVTRRHGSLVTAARTLGVKIAFTTDSGGGAGKIKAADPAALANKLAGTEVLSE